MVAAVDVIVLSADVKRTLAKINLLLSPMGMIPFLGTTVAPYLSKRAKGRFDAEGDDASGMWAALHPSTANFRESQGYAAGPINHRSGELENWVVNSGGNSYAIGPDTSMIFPGKPASGELGEKVATAQRGKTSPYTVPRPVLAVNEADLLWLQTALAFAITEAGTL